MFYNAGYVCVEDKVTSFEIQLPVSTLWLSKYFFYNAGFVCVEDKVTRFIMLAMCVWRIRLRVS